MDDSDHSNSFCSSNRSSVASHLSTWSWQTDEGYHSEDKSSFDTQTNDTDDPHQSHARPHDAERDIPIQKSTRIIRMSYTLPTYALTFTIIGLSLHMLATFPRPWPHSFPPLFTLFHLLFHVTHLAAHVLQCSSMERHCVIYGVWMYWTGWLLGVFVFSEKLSVDLTRTTACLFWLLLLERRRAWGIIMWEFLSLLNPNAADTNDVVYWQSAQFRLLAYRVWCMFGVGSMWGLFYIALARMDGYSLVYLLRPVSVFKLLSVSSVAGLSMICFWSFWTFQYRGILWKRELRKGVVVWYSEGVARAGDVE